MIADELAKDLERNQDIDYIIQISILKLRRIQIAGVKEERQKLMILETLHQSLARKIEAIEEQGELPLPNRAHAFLSILEEALTRLGLNRILKFCITIPDNLNEFPRLRLSGAKKQREILHQEASLTQLLY